MDKEFLIDFLKFYLVPVLAFLLFLLAVTLIYNRLRYGYLSYKRRIYLPKISEFLTELTFSEMQVEEIHQEVLKFKKEYPYHKKWFRKIVLASIIDLSQNLKGSLIYQVRSIYMAFGLHKYSLHLILGYGWYGQCKGIYHFQAMNFVHGQKYIKPYILSENEVLRSNAFIAHLYLTTEPFDFLVDYPYPISSVNGYKVIDVFYMKKEPIPKNIDLWLSAQNESIVILGLKVMVFYNYLGAAEKIVSLLDSPVTRIRNEAIYSVRELYILEAEIPMQKLFLEETKRNQLEILKSLQVIGGRESVSFLAKMLLRKDIDGDIKIALMRCLKAVDPDYFSSRFLYGPEIERIKKHINSPYL